MITIVKKDVTVPKLTLAKDRSEMKVPLGTEQVVIDRLLVLAEHVKSVVGEVQFTLRGKFQNNSLGQWSIQMCSGSTNGAGHSTVKPFKTFMEKQHV